MKKILAIVAVTSVVSLSACNNTGSSTSASDSAKMDSAKNMMTTPAPDTSMMKKMDTTKKDTSKMGGK